MSHSDVPNLCLKLMRDYTSQELECFADPFSKQKERLDRYGNKVGESMSHIMIWDYYEHRTVTGEWKKGQWYLDFVDNTQEGKAITDILEAITAALDKGTIATVLIDGKETDLGLLTDSELLPIKAMYVQRRYNLALAYRKAIQVYRQLIAINDKFGNKYDDKGNIISVGIVKADLVYANEVDRSRGLARTNRPICLYMVYQKDESTPWIKPGFLSGVRMYFSITDFLKLDVNKSAKTWNELINYRKQE